MKWTIVFAACMALLAVQASSVQNDLKPDISFLEKQQFFLEILYRVDEPLAFEEWIKIGSQLLTNSSFYSVYDEYMINYASLYNTQLLMPIDEFFSAVIPSQVYQLTGLFHFFYYANNWETMVHNIAWARIHVNPGMFVSALTMAVIHRDDLQGIVLPQIYEIFPQMFISSKYIMAAEKFDWEMFNRAILFEKELKYVYVQHYPNKLYGKQFYQMSFKAWQWWKLMGLDDGWHLEGKSMLRENYEVLRKDPLWMSIYSQLKMIWMPIDYSRDVNIMNADAQLAYFTEDVAWNAYWYYLNQDYSLILQSDEFGLDNDRHGEWWMYNVQQLFARYSMERLSQGLGLVEPIPWYGAILSGYDPQLIAYNGNGFTMRQNNWPIKYFNNPVLLNSILSIGSHIQDMLFEGQYMLNGTLIDLTLPEAVEFVGYLLQGNLNITGKYPSWFPSIAAYFGGVDSHFSSPAPNVMLNYETMMRDPLSYMLFKTLIDKWELYVHQLPAYTKEELTLPGVKIVSVDVSELKTYYDFTDLDISTLMTDKLIFHEGRLVWNKVLLGRQMRLNHEPFKFELEVFAEDAQEVVIRVFLGPEFDQYGQKLDMYNNLEYYMELDEFLYDLVEGKNLIVHNSEDFNWTYSDPHTYSEIYNYLSMSFEAKYKFDPQLFESHSLFPDRLILPHGWVEGMPMGLFFVISPYHAPAVPYEHSYLSGIGTGNRHIDSMPFGYPLNRPIPNLEQFIVPNMYYKTVMIYHQENFSKYYPIMYEHFGVFDESYF